MIVIIYYLTLSLPYIFYHTGMKERKKERKLYNVEYFMVKKLAAVVTRSLL